MPTADVYLNMLPEGTSMSDSERAEEALSREIEILRKTWDEQREIEMLYQENHQLKEKAKKVIKEWEKVIYC